MDLPYPLGDREGESPDDGRYAILRAGKRSSALMICRCTSHRMSSKGARSPNSRDRREGQQVNRHRPNPGLAILTSASCRKPDASQVLWSSPLTRTTSSWGRTVARSGYSTTSRRCESSRVWRAARIYSSHRWRRASDGTCFWIRRFRPRSRRERTRPTERSWTIT